MEYQGRRGRRGRGRPRANPIPSQFIQPQRNKPESVLNSLCSVFIMTGLLAIIYLMLEYHCSTCNTKCDLHNITKNIKDIEKNLSIIKDSYHDLEFKISKFSQDLPKIEGQIEILEALANTMESKDFGWDPKSHLTLPNVGVYLNRPRLDKACNNSHKLSKCNNLKPIVVNED